MPKEELSFEDFINDVDPRYRDFATQTHEYMLGEGCKLKMQLAKNGYVVSYSHGKTKRVVMNFVFRKSGLIARIYGDNVGQYENFLETLPEAMKKDIENSPKCKRFNEPPGCNSKCGGNVFTLGGTLYQKCRYNCFMFNVNDECIPFIRGFLEHELQARENGGI